jgi:hypothetical protein
MRSVHPPVTVTERVPGGASGVVQDKRPDKPKPMVRRAAASYDLMLIRAVLEAVEV